MDTLPLSDIVAAARPPTAASAAEAGGSSALTSDFETFLKMLTAQMRNQDPLNPVDSTDFAVQLATFSTVEQQVRTNELLTSLGERLGLQSMGQLAGWIGLEARVAAPVRFEGTPVRLQVEADPQATAAELRVTDAQGIVVARLPVPAETGPLLWDGRGPAGLPLPHGRYTLTLDSLVQGSVIASHPAETRARITEARIAGGETHLLLDNGQDVAADRVLGLGAPDRVGTP